MSYYESLSLKEKIKYETFKKSYERKCKCCGYTNRVMNKYKKIPCKNCGNYVFLNDFEEFKYRFKEKIYNERRKSI